MRTATVLYCMWAATGQIVFNASVVKGFLAKNLLFSLDE
jgi:hypothetical protein